MNLFWLLEVLSSISTFMPLVLSCIVKSTPKGLIFCSCVRALWATTFTSWALVKNLSSSPLNSTFFFWSMTFIKDCSSTRFVGLNIVSIFFSLFLFNKNTTSTYVPTTRIRLPSTTITNIIIWFGVISTLLSCYMNYNTM